MHLNTTESSFFLRDEFCKYLVDIFYLPNPINLYGLNEKILKKYGYRIGVEKDAKGYVITFYKNDEPTYVDHYTKLESLMLHLETWVRQKLMENSVK